MDETATVAPDLLVMAGLDPAIFARTIGSRSAALDGHCVDGRVKPGHDGRDWRPCLMLGALRRSNLGHVERRFFVYVLTNDRHTMLYTGVTSDLTRRSFDHRTHAAGGFSSHYNLTRLVYYEPAQDAVSAIAREKQIKAGSRRKKVAFLDAMNPDWRDLFDGIAQS